MWIYVVYLNIYLYIYILDRLVKITYPDINSAWIQYIVILNRIETGIYRLLTHAFSTNAYVIGFPVRPSLSLISWRIDEIIFEHKIGPLLGSDFNNETQLVRHDSRLVKGKTDV